jgi:hypothetical protein
MLETSKDLLFIVLAFCAVWLTVFICWAMYHMIAMLRDVNRIASSIRHKMELMDRILVLVREKLEHSASHMTILADAAMKLVSHFMEQKESSGGKKSAKKKS